MKKLLLFLIVLFTSQALISQNKKLWKGYFSYNQIKDLSESPNRITAAAENALFSKDLISGSVKTTNTIDGLSGLTITSLYQSTAYRKTLVGYENGLMIVINDVDGSTINVVDIINKSLPPTIKRINHFMEFNGIIYVSCDFGIVQYNLATLLFGDTYFIGDGGAQISVKQTAVFDGRIYAATGFGIRNASITNPNLNDFAQWITLDTNGWLGVETFGTNLMAISNTGYLFKWTGANFTNPTFLLEYPTDFRKSGDYLVISTLNHVYLYNSSLSQVRNITSSEFTDANIQFSCAAVVNETIYIGTTASGLYTTPLQASTFANISPAGAYRNAVFGINGTTSNLWLVYGGYDADYNPYAYFGYTPNQFDLSIYNKSGWKQIHYNDLFQAKALTSITLNPNNENQAYVSSFFSGLLKIDNFQPTVLYNETNTGTDGLKPIGNTGPENIWVNSPAFDNAGNLWMTSSLQKRALVELQANGQWKTYNMENVYLNFGLFKIGKMVIDKNNTKWIASVNDGVIGFNETLSPTVFKTLRFSDGGNTGNLPGNNVRAVAVDHDDQLWIGTIRGLRVLPNVDAFFSDAQLTAENIVFNEIIDGMPVAQELLFQQSIIDIVVDGANNKWVGTADSGVYMFSPDGQKTIYHFTADNSPLPSDTVNDIDINGKTGEVYIATTKGMVSFKGTATEANDNLDNVFVYPNPVRPEFYGTVKVSGLMDKAHVKIADIEGSLVYEAIAEGGTIEWDTTAFGKYKVASGVYMVFVSSDDGAKTKVKKVMIVR